MEENFYDIVNDALKFEVKMDVREFKPEQVPLPSHPPLAPTQSRANNGGRGWQRANIGHWCLLEKTPQVPILAWLWLSFLLKSVHTVNLPPPK